MNIGDVKKKLSTMGLLFDFEQLVFEEFDGDVFFTYPFDINEIDDEEAASFFGLSVDAYDEIAIFLKLCYVRNNVGKERVVRNKYEGWLQGQYLFEETARIEGRPPGPFRLDLGPEENAVENSRIMFKVEECLALVEYDNWFIRLGRSLDSKVQDKFICSDGVYRDLPGSLFGVMQFLEPIEEACRRYSEKTVTYEELEFFVNHFPFVGDYPYYFAHLNHWKVGSDYSNEFDIPRQVSHAFFISLMDHHISEVEKKALDESHTQFCKVNNIKILDVPYAFV